MPNTNHFRALRAETKVLRKMLPRENIFGRYSPFKVRRMIAYRVLGHSALETYFENVSASLADWSHMKHVRFGEANNILLSMCLRFSRQGEMPENVFFQKQQGNIAILVSDAKEWHHKLIRENHGIKEQNLKTLFRSFGQPIWTLISPLVDDLDVYGTIRGEYAHRSASVVNIPNPIAETTALSEIVEKIRTSDLAIHEILSS